MIISIIGSGNTATVLGKLFKENNFTINEIAGRNEILVNNLAGLLNANACTKINQLNKNSDVYIIAVKDDALAEVSAQLNMNDKIVAHTAGSVPMNVLAKTSSNIGVLYPLQSLRKELNYFPAIPFLIDANNDFTKRTIYNLATSVSRLVAFGNDKTRMQHHLSAVIVSNFTNHLFALVKDYCSKNDIDFNLLLPLIEETVNRLHFYEPATTQTGPAIRGDKLTIQKHLEMLKDFPQVKHVYEVMSESIKQHRLTP